MLEHKGDSNLISEIITRLILWMVFIYMELCTPFIRTIQPEELWRYKYPPSRQYVTSNMLWFTVIAVPMMVLTLDVIRTRNRAAFRSGILCLTLLLGLNGFVTILLKLTVGRPRPDFFWRCFPDGGGDENLECTGNPQSVLEGRKSFPSGHASFSFAGLGFLSLYLNGKWRAFQPGNGQAWKMICCLIPILVATCIAVSRTCDYHHHWEDVTVGGMLGGGLAYICYNLYFAQHPSGSTTTTTTTSN